MKTIYKFQTRVLILIFAFSSLLFNACSSDDNNDVPDPDAQEQEMEQEEMEEEANFEAVTIDFTILEIPPVSNGFTLQGFNFSTFNAGLNVTGEFAGISLAFPDDEGNPSYIELDLTGITGISSITALILNNCLESTRITIFNGDEVVDDFSAFVPTTVEETGFNDNLYEFNGQIVTAVRISSCEAIIQSITLE